MTITPSSKFRPRRLLPLLPLTAVALANATLGVSHAAAQTTAAAIANATINAAGPRTGTNGTNFFNVEGSGNNANADFGVLDFSVGSFNPGGQTASGVQGGALTLSLTESDANFTLPATLEFYLTTVTGTSIANAAGASPLKYNGTTAGDGSTPVSGIDTGLGILGGNASGSLFDLGSGSFTTTGNTHTGQLDTYTLTLGTALNAFLAELNTSGGNLRLVVASTTAAGAATFFGAGNATAANRPTLSFTPTFVTTNPKYWQGGDGGSWTPTSANFGSSVSSPSGTAAWDNGGTATAIFANAANTVNINAGNINAAGLEFDATGYTINGTGAGNTLTLTGGHSVNVVNATDTAAVNVPIAGTVGLAKLGAGTLVLGGTNTFTGGVNITAGTLSISADVNLGAVTNGIVLNNGGTLNTTGSIMLNAGRTFTGTGGSLGVTAGQTLTINGDTNITGTLALTGAGNVTLGDASGRGYDNIGGLTFSNASTLKSTGVLGISTALAANHTSGTAILNGSILLASTSAGTTAGPAINVTVANPNATLQITGAVGGGTISSGGFSAGNATLVKQGLGTLDLLGDNSALTSSSATSGTIRQGTAGAVAGVSGGTLLVHTNTGLGGFISGSTTVGGQYQFNNGTFVNASGGLLTFANGLSIGGGGAVASGASFGRAGANDAASVFTGAVSLFNATTGGAYQHVITVNAPTTFSGQFTSSTGTNNGLLITGSSMLTLNSTAARNTFTENITIDSRTTLSLLATGSLDKNALVTLNANATLSLTLAGANGQTDLIGDSTFLNLSTGSKVVLNLSGAVETVYGLELNGVVQPAGLYSAATPGGYFTGTGFINNLGATAAVPEPSSYLMVVGAIGLLAAARRGRCRHA